MSHYLPFKVYNQHNLLLASFLHEGDAKIFVNALAIAVCRTYADACIIKETAE